MPWIYKANLKGVQGNVGPIGPQGLPGTNAVPSDTAVAGFLSTTGTSESKTALNAAITKADYFASPRIFGSVGGWAYGNSWIASPTYATQYPLRLPALLGLTSITNLATSGYRMQDTSVTALGTDGTKNWAAGRAGFVVVGDLLNNLIEADDTPNRAAALQGMRSLVALISAKTRTDDTNAAFTFTGTWTTLTTPTVSNGSARVGTATSLAAGTEDTKYCDVAIPAGVNYLILTGTPIGSTVGAKAIVREGATLLDSIDTNGTTVATPSGPALGGRAPVVLKIPGTTARTVRVTFTTPTGTSTATTVSLIVDGLASQSDTPPLIVLVKPVAVLASSHNKPALLTYLRTVPDTVAAEFGKHVLVVDPNTGWNTATMLGADGLHPNELGQQFLADSVVSAVRAEVSRRAAASLFTGLV